MKKNLRIVSLILIVLFQLNCSNSDNRSASNESRFSLPEPDKDLREDYEAYQKHIATGCLFDNPDTSVSNIKINDPESATRVLKVKRLDGDTTYHFSSGDRKQELSVTVHPGSFYSAISIFRVEYVGDSKPQMLPTTIQNFTTEKGIGLGLNKKTVISKLGNCFWVTDSTKNYITLHYRLESPKDSRTKLLARHNMPIYYGSYIFKDEKLQAFEFGFEYP